MRLRSTRLRCSAAPASHFAVLPSTHAYGDTRMGDNRETNVVNRWGFSHEVPNMGILGGCLSWGQVEPTTLRSRRRLWLANARPFVASSTRLSIAEGHRVSA
jgi:hypothetical protein